MLDFLLTISNCKLLRGEVYLPLLIIHIDPHSLQTNSRTVACIALQIVFIALFVVAFAVVICRNL